MTPQQQFAVLENSSNLDIATRIKRLEQLKSAIKASSMDIGQALL